MFYLNTPTPQVTLTVISSTKIIGTDHQFTSTQLMVIMKYSLQLLVWSEYQVLLYVHL